MQSILPQPAGGRRIAGTAHTLPTFRGRVAPTCGRRRLVSFLLLALCSAAWGQDSMAPKQPPDRIVTPLRVADVAGGPADLRLTGPSAGAVGSPVSIVVSGLPAVDLTATVGAQTAWVQSIRFDVSAPAGAEIELEKELSMSVSPWAWRLRLTLTPPGPGTYLVVCDWNQEPYGLAMHRVEVTGADPMPPSPPGPKPPPNPNPQPQPNPNQTTSTALILLETSDSNQQHELLRQAIRRDAALSPRILILDPDSRTEADQPDPIVQAARAHLGSRPLPRVLGQSPDGGFLWDAELPADVEGLRKLLHERGMR